MARFRFKIVDSQGRRRSGVLRADSLEVARSALHSKLCQIEELTPLPDEGQAVEVNRLERSFHRLDLARRGLMALFGGIFLLSLYAWFGQPKAPAASAAPTVPDQTSTFRARGGLTLGPSQGEPSEWTVRLQFPELPYEVGGVLDDAAGGQFEFPIDLPGERPRKVDVEVEHEGRRWRIAGGKAVPAQGDLELGQFEVVPPEAEEEPPSVAAAAPSPGAEPRRKGRPLQKKDILRVLKAKQQRGQR